VTAPSGGENVGFVAVSSPPQAPPEAKARRGENFFCARFYITDTQKMGPHATTRALSEPLDRAPSISIITQQHTQHSSQPVMHKLISALSSLLSHVHGLCCAARTRCASLYTCAVNQPHRLCHRLCAAERSRARCGGRPVVGGGGGGGEPRIARRRRRGRRCRHERWCTARRPRRRLWRGRGEQREKV
jgi:hypothetical protein